MAYAKQRFLTNNLLTLANMTASSQGAGLVASPKKTGTGTAGMTSSGAYTGKNDVLVTVQCDLAGTVGSGATFRWKTSDTTAGTWEASSVSATTSLTSLGSAGLSIRFSTGTLILGDQWQFWAYATYGMANLLQNDRDKWFKSGAVSSDITIIVDLGSALAITAFCLSDHNITSGATVKLQANSSNSWTTPAYTLTLTQTDQPMVNYISQSYRYWRVLIQDASNPDGYVGIGKLYLGTYTEIASGELWGAADWGVKRTRERTRLRTESEAGKSRRRVYSDNEAFPLSYKTLNDTELATLRGIWDATFDTATGQDKSVFVHFGYDTPSTCFLCECLSENFDATYQRGRIEASIQWRQEVMTRTL
jgi:hypothetical protein